MPLPFSNSGVPDDQLAIIRGYYDDAAEKLRKIVLNPVGMKESSIAFRQSRAAQLIQQVHQVQRRLDASADQWIGINIYSSYKDGLRWGSKQAIQAGMPGERVEAIKDSFSLINHQAVVRLAMDTHLDLSKSSEGMAAQSEQALRKMALTGVSTADVNRILAGGVITGEPVQTSRELRTLFERIHGKELVIIDKNGNPIHYETKYYADMVARTKTREAVVRASHDRLQETGIDIVAIDGRPSKNFCSAFLGMYFSLSGRSKDYPALSSLPRRGSNLPPPFHPFCSKSTRAVIVELATAKQKEHGDGVEDADKLLGVSPEEAQRRYQDLQIHASVNERFPTNPRPPKAPAKGAA